ncbi:MAG: Rrf2 family transcriptional regulator [Candidatus Pacebacteria bacterium]|nr:Rrf2 family transcriptional regulator [Candidatus Paceibacterota bacterium]
MKLSTRSRYGLRIMIQIGRNEQNGPVLARELAEEQNITPAYVDQILIPLRGSGLVVSYRGRHGGYKLGKDPADITALEVVETLEGPLSLVECVTDSQSCDRVGACATHYLWRSLVKVMRDKLRGFTIAGLAEEQKMLEEEVEEPAYAEG